MVVNAPANPSFEVRNLGLAELTLTKFKFPRGFTFIDPIPSTVDAIDTQAFSVSLTPTRTGNFSGKVSFTTNDADEKKFDFTVQWTVVDTLAAQAPDTPAIDVDSIIDLNNDWVTNTADLVTMLRALGSNDVDADLNNDDRVNAADVAALLAAF